MPTRPNGLAVLVVGPADGTALRRAVAALFAAGHAPVPCDTATAYLPEVAAGRSRYVRRLLLHCDAVLCLPDPSGRDDSLVRYARWEGKPVYRDVHDIVRASTGQARTA